MSHYDGIGIRFDVYSDGRKVTGCNAMEGYQNKLLDAVERGKETIDPSEVARRAKQNASQTGDALATFIALSSV